MQDGLMNTINLGGGEQVNKKKNVGCGYVVIWACKVKDSQVRKLSAHENKEIY